MVGLRDAGWRVALIQDSARSTGPLTTPDDLVVLDLGAPVDPSLVARLDAAGGGRVPAHNPWWDQIGVTIEDPDGYRLALRGRGWGDSS